MTWTNLFILVLIMLTVIEIMAMITIFDMSNRIHTYLENRQKLEDARLAPHREKIEYLKKQLGGE